MSTETGMTGLSSEGEIRTGFGYGADVDGQDQDAITHLSPAKEIIVGKAEKGEASAEALSSKVEGEMGAKEDNDYEGYGCQEK
jgi:hypothetical protein